MKAIALLLLSATLALVSCGDDETKTVTRGITLEVDGNGTAKPIVNRPAFQSPSGNIGCMISAEQARCDIAERSWSAERPADCPDESDFGQGLEVGSSGRGEVVCAGDTARDPGSPKLSYGTASQEGDFICVSRSSGITCANSSNGHGFLINRERYRLF